MIRLGEGFFVGRPGVVDAQTPGHVAVQALVSRLHPVTWKHVQFGRHVKAIRLGWSDAEEAVIEMGKLACFDIGYVKITAVNAPLFEIADDALCGVAAAPAHGVARRWVCIDAKGEAGRWAAQIAGGIGHPGADCVRAVVGQGGWGERPGLGRVVDTGIAQHSGAVEDAQGFARAKGSRDCARKGGSAVVGDGSNSQVALHDAHVVRHGCNRGGERARATSASRISAAAKSGVCFTGTRTCSGPGPGPGRSGALICVASIGGGVSGEPEEIVHRLAAEIGTGLEVGAQAGAGCQGLGGGPTGG